VTDQEEIIINRVVSCAAIGGFFLMALIGWMLAFDVASIASLIAESVDRDILTGLIIGGSITKGVVAGGAIGLASLSALPPKVRSASPVHAAHR